MHFRRPSNNAGSLNCTLLDKEHENSCCLPIHTANGLETGAEKLHYYHMACMNALLCSSILTLISTPDALLHTSWISTFSKPSILPLFKIFPLFRKLINSHLFPSYCSFSSLWIGVHYKNHSTIPPHTQFPSRILSRSDVDAREEWRRFIHGSRCCSPTGNRQNRDVAVMNWDRGRRGDQEWNRRWLMKRATVRGDRLMNECLHVTAKQTPI